MEITGSGRCKILGMVGVLLAAGTGSAAWTQEPPPVTAFIDVSVIPMDQERVLAHQTVVVQGDRIVALAPAAEVQVPAGAQRIDGRGKYLIPGLGDMHAHGVAPGSPKLLRWLAQGTTTVREAKARSSGPDAKAMQAKRAVARGALLGPRIYVAGYVRFKSDDRSAALSVADSIAALKRDGYDFLKLYAWPRPVYDSAVAAARRVGLPVIGHVPVESGDPALDANLERVLQDRWASIEHVTGYFHSLTGGFPERSPLGKLGPEFEAALDTATWMQPDFQWDPAKIRAAAEATQRAGVWNSATLAVSEQMRQRAESNNLGSKRSRFMLRWVDLQFRMVKALQEAGAGVLLGSEATAPEELRVMVERAGLTPYEALATGTRNIAVFLEALDSTGTVAVGKRADLVLLAGNPLADIRAVESQVGVMVGGRWLAQAELEAGIAERRSIPRPGTAP